jgi:hypothetical protein
LPDDSISPAKLYSQSAKDLYWLLSSIDRSPQPRPSNSAAIASEFISLSITKISIQLLATICHNIPLSSLENEYPAGDTPRKQHFLSHYALPLPASLPWYDQDGDFTFVHRDCCPECYHMTINIADSARAGVKKSFYQDLPCINTPSSPRYCLNVLLDTFYQSMLRGNVPDNQTPIACQYQAMGHKIVL